MTRTHPRPLVAVRLAASMVAVALAVGTSGCAVPGKRATQAELEAALAQAIPAGTTILGSTATAGDTTWSVRDSDGVTFKCVSTINTTGEYTAWGTYCDYATEWVVARQQFRVAWAQWQPDFTEPSNPFGLWVATLHVQRGADLAAFGQAFADALNQNRIPVATQTVTSHNGNFNLYLPSIDVYAGGTSNSEARFGRWTFLTTNDPPVNATQMIQEVKTRYARVFG